MQSNYRAALFSVSIPNLLKICCCVFFCFCSWSISTTSKIRKAKIKQKTKNNNNKNKSNAYFKYILFSNKANVLNKLKCLWHEQVRIHLVALIEVHMTYKFQDECVEN